MNELEEHLALDVPKIKNAIRLQVPIEITSYTLSRNMELYMHKVLGKFLEECHQEHLKVYLDFCLGELLTNGKKANTKRVYFKEKGLDINDLDDYKKGMETFIDDTLENINYYLELQKKEGLYVKFSIRLDIDRIIVEIKNKSVMNSIEKERINNKLNSAQQYNSMEEVMSKVLDTSEGAGLGIIIMILMLQKVGLSKKNFKIYSTDKETITSITLPCNNDVYSLLYDVSERFAKKEEKLPIFEQTLTEIQTLVSNDVINKNEILACIRKNSTLSMTLIKKAIDKNIFDMNIFSILEQLSDEDLRDIFISNGLNLFRTIPETDRVKNNFEHARKVSIYCYNIAKNLSNLNVDINCDCEQIFTIGLLSNIGLLMIETPTEEQLKIISEIKDKHIEEIFYSGITSGFINLTYTKMINIPEEFVCQLAGWNCLRMCPQRIASGVRILYLAEIIQYYSEGLVEYYQIDKSILEEFKIENENQLNYIINLMQGSL